MENNCRCLYCCHTGPTLCEGYRWYCEVYDRFEDPNQVRDCTDYHD